MYRSSALAQEDPLVGAPARLRNLLAIEHEFTLPCCRLGKLAGDHRWKVIICHAGEVWITQQFDPEDYILKAGETFIITQLGTVVFEALKEARIQITTRLSSELHSRTFSETAFA